MRKRPTGLTRDVGWEIGVSRTVPIPVEEVWDFVTSAEGSAMWLGAGVHRLDEPGRAYETAAGTSGEIRSFRPLSPLRNHEVHAVTACFIQCGPAQRC